MSTTTMRKARGTTARELTAREVILLGALGGVTVSFGAYPDIITGDFQALLGHDTLHWVGFALRTAICAAIGGFWVYLHSPESDRKRAFQLGLVAPAAIASLIYANYDPKPTPAPAGPVASAAPQTGSLGDGSLPGRAGAPRFAFLVSPANATPLLPLVQQQEPAKPTLIDRVVKGILGK